MWESGWSQRGAAASPTISCTRSCRQCSSWLQGRTSCRTGLVPLRTAAVHCTALCASAGLAWHLLSCPLLTIPPQSLLLNLSRLVSQHLSPHRRCPCHQPPHPARTVRRIPLRLPSSWGRHYTWMVPLTSWTARVTRIRRAASQCGRTGSSARGCRSRLTQAAPCVLPTCLWSSTMALSGIPSQMRPPSHWPMGHQQLSWGSRGR